ncbi:MAG: hypothetical protein SFW66_04180 [Gammaproteobacteria bacterium]|nr:hypothetical protein [Gammaproteobacteria bacterium]
MTKKEFDQLLISSDINSAVLQLQRNVILTDIKKSFRNTQARQEEYEACLWVATVEMTLLLSIELELLTKNYGFSQGAAQRMVRSVIGMFDSCREYSAQHSDKTDTKGKFCQRIKNECQKVLLGEKNIVDAMTEIDISIFLGKDMLDHGRSRLLYRNLATKLKSYHDAIGDKQEELIKIHKEHNENIRVWLKENITPDHNAIEIQNEELNFKYRMIRQKMLTIAKNYKTSYVAKKQIADVVILTLESGKYPDRDAINNVRDMLASKSKVLESARGFFSRSIPDSQSKLRDPLREQINLFDQLPEMIELKRQVRKSSDDYSLKESNSSQSLSSFDSMVYEQKNDITDSIEFKEEFKEENMTIDVPPRVRLEKLLSDDIEAKVNDDDYIYLRNNSFLKEKYIESRIHLILGVYPLPSYYRVRKFSVEEQKQHDRQMESMLKDELTLSYLKQKRKDTQHYNILGKIFNKLNDYIIHIQNTDGLFNRSSGSHKKVEAVRNIIKQLQNTMRNEESMYQRLVDIIENGFFDFGKKIKAHRNPLHGCWSFFFPAKTEGEKLLEEIYQLVPEEYRLERRRHINALE